MDYKSSLDIEKDMYLLVKQYLSDVVSGGIYRAGAKPFGKGEDVVVTHLTGMDGQTQKGVVVVSVYIPMIHTGQDLYQRDINRCSEISSVLFSMIKTYRSGEYRLKLNKNIELHEQDNISIVTLRIDYKRNMYHLK